MAQVARTDLSKYPAPVAATIDLQSASILPSFISASSSSTFAKPSYSTDYSTTATARNIFDRRHASRSSSAITSGAAPILINPSVHSHTGDITATHIHSRHNNTNNDNSNKLSHRNGKSVSSSSVTRGHDAESRHHFSSSSPMTAPSDSSLRDNTARPDHSSSSVGTSAPRNGPLSSPQSVTTSANEAAMLTAGANQVSTASHSFDAERAERSSAIDDRSGVPNGPPSPDSLYSAMPADPTRSTPPPVMGMVNAFTDMTLGAPMAYPPHMHLMPVQPHPVMPLVPPQHVAQLPPQHRQPGPPAPPPPPPPHHPHHPHHPMLPNQRTSAYHWVPQDRVGAVIGGHGAVIRSLQDKSGAIIQVHNATIRDDHKLFTILGYPSQIETAIQLIADIVGRTRSGHVTPNSGNVDRPPHYSSRHAGRANDLGRTILVPTSCVGLVIGRNGDTIRNLQDSSGAEIKVTPDQHAQPGQPNRPILITGTEEAIAIANRLITDIVMDARSRRHSMSNPPLGGMINGEVVIMEELRVPNEKVGLIIGKKGVAIRELQVRSGAKIQVTKDDSSVQTDGTRPVSITGTRSQVDEACSLIASKISVPYLASSTIGASTSAMTATGATASNSGALPATTGGASGVGDNGTAVASSDGGGTPNLAYGFPGGYDSEFGNGQQGFQPVFDGNDPTGHGRTPAMTYVQYVGYNNYGAPPHARMASALSVPYGGQGQQGLSPSGMGGGHGGSDSVTGSDGPDGGVTIGPYAGGAAPVDGVPSSPGVVPTRDVNGNVLMFGTHGAYPGHPLLATNPGPGVLVGREGMHPHSLFAQDAHLERADAKAQGHVSVASAQQPQHHQQHQKQGRPGREERVGGKEEGMKAVERREEDADRRSQEGSAGSLSSQRQPKEGTANG